MKVCWVLRCHISFSQEESGLTCPDSLVWLEGRWLILPTEWEREGCCHEAQTSQNCGADAATHGRLRGTCRISLQANMWVAEPTKDKLLTVWCCVPLWSLFPPLSNRWGKSTTTEQMNRPLSWQSAAFYCFCFSLTINVPTPSTHELNMKEWRFVTDDLKKQKNDHS